MSNDVDRTNLDLKRAELLHGLARATDVGKLIWSDTSEENTFVTQANDVSIELKYDDDSLKNRRYTITINDKAGKIVDHFNVWQLLDIDAICDAARDLEASVEKAFRKVVLGRLDRILEAISE